MPTYEYKCQTCGHQFEFFQSMNDDRLTDCPLDACEGKVKRLIGTGAGIIFKGSGFYQTDYRSDSYKKGAKADSSSGDGKSSSGDGKSSSSDGKSSSSDGKSSSGDGKSTGDSKSKAGGDGGKSSPPATTAPAKKGT